MTSKLGFRLTCSAQMRSFRLPKPIVTYDRWVEGDKRILEFRLNLLGEGDFRFKRPGAIAYPSPTREGRGFSPLSVNFGYECIKVPEPDLSNLYKLLETLEVHWEG